LRAAAPAKPAIVSSPAKRRRQYRKLPGGFRVLRKCLGSIGANLLVCWQTVARMSLFAAFCSAGPVDGVGELKSDCHRKSRW